MTRIIDADEVFGMENAEWWLSRQVSTRHIKACLDQRADFTVDAVPVVRCRECYHHVIHEGVNGIASHMFCGKTEQIVKPDWYCADGERDHDTD